MRRPRPGTIGFTLLLSMLGGTAMLATPTTPPPAGSGHVLRPSSPDRPGLLRPREIPTNLDTSLFRRSDDGLFRVTLRCLRATRPLNRIHTWSVSVRDADGAPIDDATVELVGGGMPAHNHGFPTEPRVTRRIAPGTWLIEGVKFNMTGWWRFELAIRAGEATDRVAFNVVVDG